MQQHFDGVTYALGSAEIEMQMADVRPLPIFSAEAVAFLTALSARILADAEAKAYPDVVTLGFWCRPASIHRILCALSHSFKYIVHSVSPFRTALCTPLY